MHVDVDKVIEQSRIGPLHSFIVAIGFLIMLFDGYDLVAMAMIVPVISAEWGLQPSDFSLALSAALFGVLFGSGGAGIMGDWIGRRWTIVTMLLIAGVSMCMTPFVSSMNELIAVRFITGIGAGGCIPVTLAYTLEFMPRHVRNLLTVFMYSGAAMGTVIGGFLGPTLLGMGGWAYVFYFGGFLPITVVAIVLLVLPESLRFLVNKHCKPEVAGALLQRINLDFHHAPGNDYGLKEVMHKGSPIRELFGGRQTAITLMLWLVFFGSQFLLFFVGLWMPTLLIAEGISLETALYVLALYNLGGVVGGTAFGATGDRLTPMPVLVVAFSLAAVLVVAFGYSTHSTPLLIGVAILAGGTVAGSALMLGAVATGLYPTRARSTGIGWALGIGRFGSITAPLIGGAMLASGMGIKGMYSFAAVPAILCAGGMLVLWRLTRVHEAELSSVS
jgi:benzoate transport